MKSVKQLTIIDKINEEESFLDKCLSIIKKQKDLDKKLKALLLKCGGCKKK